MIESTTPVPKPVARREWPSWSYYPANVLVRLLLLPIVKILECFGLWPKLISRGMSRMMENAQPFEPEANDVLVCSYFKSGTNWTMQTALQIAHRGRAEFGHIHDIVPWYELPETMHYSVPMSEQGVRHGAVHGLRIIKTHLALGELAYSDQGRYIWVIRDPKDVFVSSYHFIRSTGMGPLMPSVSNWLRLFLSPDAPLGSWAVHVKDGWEHRDAANLLFLTYEEMKVDSRAAIRKMAAFLGVDLSPDEMAAVAERSSFEYMKAISHKFDPVGIGPPWARPRGAMLRRGRHGASGELLSAEDQRRIDDYWRQELRRIDCDFPYDEMYAAGASGA